MAATISANPNPVLFPSPHLGTLPRKTTITWDTGANDIKGPDDGFNRLGSGCSALFQEVIHRQGERLA